MKCQDDDDQSVRHVKFGQHKDAIKTSWSGGWTFVKVPLCCATLFQKFLDTTVWGELNFERSDKGAFRSSLLSFGTSDLLASSILWLHQDADVGIIIRCYSAIFFSQNGTIDKLMKKICLLLISKVDYEAEERSETFNITTRPLKVTNVNFSTNTMELSWEPNPQSNQDKYLVSHGH